MKAAKDNYTISLAIHFPASPTKIDSIVVLEESEARAGIYQFFQNEQHTVVSPQMPYGFVLSDTLPVSQQINYYIYRYAGDRIERMQIRLDDAKGGFRYKFGEINFRNGIFRFTHSMFVDHRGKTRYPSYQEIENCFQGHQAPIIFSSSAIPEDIASQNWIPFDEIPQGGFGQAPIFKGRIYKNHQTIYMPRVTMPEVEDYQGSVTLKRLWISEDSAQYRAEYLYDQGACIDTASMGNYFRWDDEYFDWTVEEVESKTGKQIITKNFNHQLYIFKYFWNPEYLRPSVDSFQIYAYNGQEVYDARYGMWQQSPGMRKTHIPITKVLNCEPFQVIMTIDRGLQQIPTGLEVDELGFGFNRERLLPPNGFPGKIYFITNGYGGYPINNGVTELNVPLAFFQRKNQMQWKLWYYGALSPKLISATVDNPQLKVQFQNPQLEFGKAHILTLEFDPEKFKPNPNANFRLNIKLEFEQRLHYDFQVLLHVLAE